MNITRFMSALNSGDTDAMKNCLNKVWNKYLNKYISIYIWWFIITQNEFP